MKSSTMTPTVSTLHFAQLIALGVSLCDYSQEMIQQDEAASEVNAAGFSLASQKKIEGTTAGESSSADPEVARHIYRKVALNFITAAGRVNVQGVSIENKRAIAASAKISTVLDTIVSSKDSNALSFKRAAETWNQVNSQAKQESAIVPVTIRLAYEATADAFLALARQGNGGYGLQA